MSHDDQMPRLGLSPYAKRGSNMSMLLGKHESKARLMRRLGHGNKRKLKEKHRESEKACARACSGNAHNIS